MEARSIPSGDSASGLGSFGNPRYMNLTTFRRDGREVTTPVWPVRLDERLFFGTDRTCGKYKRLGKTGRVRFAPCNANGSKVLGEWHDGQAQLLRESELGFKKRIEGVMKRKYGWQYWLIMALYKFQGRYDKRVIYEIIEG